MNKAELWSESMAGSVSWEGRSDLGSPVHLLCGLGQFQAPCLNFPFGKWGQDIIFFLTFSSISYFIIWNNTLAPLFLFNLFLLDLCLDPKKCPVCQMKKKKKSRLYLSLMLIKALRYSLLSHFPFHCQTSWNSSLYSCLHLPHFSFLNILQPGLCTHWLYWNFFQEPTISVLSKIKAFSF